MISDKRSKLASQKPRSEFAESIKEEELDDFLAREFNADFLEEIVEDDKEGDPTHIDHAITEE